MLCPKCLKELNLTVLDQCKVLQCPNKEPVNTSGKVNQLFTVMGSGFEVDNTSIHESLKTLYFPH